MVTSLRKREPVHRNFFLRGMDGERRELFGTAIPLIGEEARLLGALGLFWEPNGSELGTHNPLADRKSGQQQHVELILMRRLACHLSTPIYRITGDGATLCYIPDHEPALGAENFCDEPNWLSGYDLAQGADLLIHDSQYTPEQYANFVGWGHSSIEDALAFATAAKVRHFVAFHHDPSHTDAILETLYSDVRERSELPFELSVGFEGQIFEIAKNGATPNSV